MFEKRIEGNNCYALKNSSIANNIPRFAESNKALKTSKSL